MAPMRQGQRLTRRSALKVVLSRELPRSAGARVAARVQQVDGALVVGQRRVGGLLDWRGQRRPLTLVAEIGQGDVLGVGPLGQQRQRLGMGAQRGGVVLATRPHRRGPDRPAVGRGDDLDVAAVSGVLARPPQVDLAARSVGPGGRAGNVAAVGPDQRAVHGDVRVAGGAGRQQCAA
jgi:hypothetical protein